MIAGEMWPFWAVCLACKKNQICLCAVDLLGLSPARKSLQVAFFLRRVFFLILFVSFPGWIGWDSAGWADRTL